MKSIIDEIAVLKFNCTWVMSDLLKIKHVIGGNGASYEMKRPLDKWAMLHPQEFSFLYIQLI